MRMNVSNGPRIWWSNTVFFQGGDARASIGWTSAIDELLKARLCKDINGKGQIFELMQRAFNLLEKAPRERFDRGSEVYVDATIRKSLQNPSLEPDQLLKYIVRMPRSFVEGEGIEWNYDYILRDEGFRIQIISKIFNIETQEELGNLSPPAFSYGVETLEFY